MAKIKVELSEKLINNPSFWKKTGETSYMSNHCYRGSAIETDNSCGNCDGARCEGCKRVVVESHWRFICYSDVLYKDFIEQGLSEGVASDLAYSDWGCKTHYYNMPTNIPEACRVALETPDEEVWAWCNEHCAEYPNEYAGVAKYSSWNMWMGYLKELLAKGYTWEDKLRYYQSQFDSWFKQNGYKQEDELCLNV